MIQKPALNRLVLSALLTLRLFIGPISVLGDEPPAAPAACDAPAAGEMADETPPPEAPDSAAPRPEIPQPEAPQPEAPATHNDGEVAPAAEPAPPATEPAPTSPDQPAEAPSPPAPPSEPVTTPADAPPAASVDQAAGENGDCPAGCTPAAVPTVAATSPAFRPALLANEAASTAVAIRLDRSQFVYRQGQRLAAEFAAEQPAHLYVLYHQADGVTRLLFPNRAQASSRVDGAPLVVPARGGAFRFRITAPLGHETLQVLAAPQPIELLEAIDRSADAAPAVPADVLASLAAYVQANPSAWAENRVDVQTVPGIGLTDSAAAASTPASPPQP